MRRYVMGDGQFLKHHQSQINDGNHKEKEIIPIECKITWEQKWSIKK
jgi:hypothetical protein